MPNCGLSLKNVTNWILPKTVSIALIKLNLFVDKSKHLSFPLLADPTKSRDVPGWKAPDVKVSDIVKLSI